MKNQTERKYPVGIQTFSEIIRGDYVYVDKTDLMWKMQRYAKFIFLSRPRRFGKSLLSSTLHSFFAGERELIEGLKVVELETEWVQYPVLHFDLSGTKHLEPQGVKEELNRLLMPYEAIYGASDAETTHGMRLAGLIVRAAQKTGKKVVLIIDEYDTPLLDVLHKDKSLAEMREIMQEFYQRLKMCDPYLRFCFITGITKFSQLSVFSTINNLKNISMLPQFSAICGITETELLTVLKEDIERMAQQEGVTPDYLFLLLKKYYDGYHFASASEDIYNPYSLLNAFGDGELNSYWFSSGAPTFLIRQMQHFQTDITQMDDIEAPASAFDVPTEAMNDALPLFYQSGYLTIKGYDRDLRVYTLSIPNQEVRIGYTEGVMPTYIGLKPSDVQIGFAAKFWRTLKKDDIEQALREMQTFLTSLPYVEGFKKKLSEATTAEGFYEYTLYLIFSMLNVYVQTQVKCLGGRIDMVVKMPQTTYVFEFKTHGTAQEALSQIDTHGYALPYQTQGRNVVKIGVRFNVETRTMEDWVVA